MYRDRGRAQQLDSSPSPGAFNKDIEIEWVGNRHVGEIQGSLGPRSASTTSSNVGEMTKPASRRLNRRWRPNGIDVIGRGVGRRSPPGRINFVGIHIPSCRLTDTLAWNLAASWRETPRTTSRIHRRAAADHAIVNEKAAHSAITETVTD